MNNVKKSIGWADWTVNPIKGVCPVGCPYCYANAMSRRFKRDPTVRYDPGVFEEVRQSEAGERIFVGSTHELFLPQYEDWTREILRIVSDWPNRKFLFLTKRPDQLAKFSPFPKNAWVGVSTTGFDSRSGLEDIFAPIKASVKFVSIEPLLDYTPMDFRWVDWVIVGQQTPASAKTAPKIEWIREIVEAADKAGAKVFLKSNLTGLLPEEMPFYNVIDEDPWLTPRLRQELPEVRG